VLFLSRVRVCRCRGWCSLSVCVYYLLISFRLLPSNQSPRPHRPTRGKRTRGILISLQNYSYTHLNIYPLGEYLNTYLLGRPLTLLFLSSRHAPTGQRVESARGHHAGRDVLDRGGAGGGEVAGGREIRCTTADALSTISSPADHGEFE